MVYKVQLQNHGYGFAYCWSGTRANVGITGGKYGEKYGIGDTIVCAVDLQNKPLASVGFSKNEKWLSVRYFNAGPYGLGVLDSPRRRYCGGGGGIWA